MIEATGDPDETDEALLARFAAGDHSAARVLTRRLTPRVLALATRMLRDPVEAEDVAQEAMVRLWRIAPDWRAGEAKVSTWLHRITSNLCIDRLRKRKRIGPGLDEIAEPPDPAPSADTRLIAGDRASALKAAINALPDRQRVAITLRHFEDYSNPEIAKVLEVSVEAVESLLSRGRKSLARALSETQGLADSEDQTVSMLRSSPAKRMSG
ncbi:MAG: RNA polymerase sigma factor [Pseudomonadota bacterium]